MCIYLHVYPNTYGCIYTHTLLLVYILTEDTMPGLEDKNTLITYGKSSHQRNLLHECSGPQSPQVVVRDRWTCTCSGVCQGEDPSG